jgi:uncharacterized membrane protein YfcA
MLAVIACLVSVIGAVLAWTDNTISVQHLLAIAFVVLLFIAGHLAFRLWWPDARRW